MPKHLTKQFNTWTYQRRVPAELKDHPKFTGKKVIRKSLKTDSLQVALKLRDAEDAKLEAIIRGDLISEYEEAYRQLVEDEGHPATATDDKLENLWCALDSLEDTYDLGGRLDPAYKKDPMILAFKAYIDRARGKTKAPIKATLLQALEIARSKAKANGQAQRYINSFDNAVSQFITFLGVADIELDWIDTQTVDDFIEHRLSTVTPKTVKNDITALSSIFRTVKRKNMVTSNNPFLEPNLSTKRTKHREAFSVSEASAILEALPEKFKLVWRIAYYTGIRREELFKLSASSIVMKESEKGNIKCFSIAPNGEGKTVNATRYIPIHPELEPHLEGFNGFDFAPNTFGTHRLKTTIKLYGKEFAESHSLHSLRHTFSTTLHNHLREQPHLVDWLTGHTRTIRTESYQTYFHGYGLDILYEAVTAIPKI
ncbi:DUF6538 domain-containing protein [Thiomicrorhabdus sp. Kp2]|uniref:DUF6538 domain-containing protein n=1 Tax=Thiomicrorhabdus sp. Kp2 TaxID=1123518 RepID=UPI0004134F7D|nr:DUF6538 domain-containing protein [Thiomicrorhabdus sp. Kp2]